MRTDQPPQCPGTEPPTAYTVGLGPLIPPPTFTCRQTTVFSISKGGYNSAPVRPESLLGLSVQASLSRSHLCQLINIQVGPVPSLLPATEEQEYSSSPEALPEKITSCHGSSAGPGRTGRRDEAIQDKQWGGGGRTADRRSGVARWSNWSRNAVLSRQGLSESAGATGREMCVPLLRARVRACPPFLWSIRRPCKERRAADLQCMQMGPRGNQVPR